MSFLAYIGDFWRQFRALAWKNSKIKTRHWIVLVIEIVIPTALIFALGFVKGIIKPEVHPALIPDAQFWDGTVRSILQQYNGAVCGSQNLVWRCTNGDDKMDAACDQNGNNPWMPGYDAVNFPACSLQKIAVAPLKSGGNAASDAAEFVTWANAINTYNENGVTIPPPFVLFDSEQEFLDILNSPEYSFTGDIYSSAVVFNDGFPAWDYTLRLNKTFNLYGHKFFDAETSGSSLDLSLKSPLVNPAMGYGDIPPFFSSWVEDGYLALTNTVNSFIASKTCINAGTCNSGEVYDYQLTISNPFPSPEYGTTGFWGFLGNVFAIDMIVVLLYPLANVISALVREKEAKLREGMKMMSLKTEVLWVSWWFNFMALFLPLSILLTVVGNKLFEYSDKSLIFLYFFMFFLSSTSYAIFMSAFFTNSRTAAIVGSLIFLGGFFLFVGIYSSDPTNSTILLCCLHPGTAFTFATLAFQEYEDSKIGVTSFTWDSSNDYNITFRECLIMMLVDAIWLSVFSWYFDKIWPSEYGTNEPWYFILNPFYWAKVFGLSTSNNPSGATLTDASAVMVTNVETVSESLSSQLHDKTCVDIQNLRKEFATPQGTKVAVDGLNLTMYRGQITALLGHNGAGKSTAIAILTGLISADSGTAIIEGKDIREDMSDIRKNLGVCPQHDILFPDLTVYEHLRMFAMFKGVKSADLETDIDAMVASVGLTEKKHVASSMLSGGQKRKLSVGIAFIGGSRIVFLDEPTSGMDPYSRRFTWNVIRQHREGRIIVLTTHFMDEADLLGDRIAIMGDGKLCCCGSSLYLKNLYGVGYSMTLEKKNANTFDSAVMTNLVKAFVPQALLLTDVGTEISFQLPFAASASFPRLFEKIEKELSKLGLESYGVSVTTLEEVFIKITRATHTNTTAQNAMSKSGTKLTSGVANEDILVVSPPAEHSNEHDPATASVVFEKIPEQNQMQYFMHHFIALLLKRLIYFSRDRKAQIFTFLVPILFVLAGLLIMKNTYPSSYEPNLRISSELYNTKVAGNVSPTPYMNPASYTYMQVNRWNPDQKNNGWPPVGPRDSVSIASAQSALDKVSSKFPLLNVIDGDGSPQNTTPYNISEYLVNHQHDYESMMVGAFFMTDTLLLNPTPTPTPPKTMRFGIATNYTAIFGVPLYQQLMADAVVKSLYPSASVSSNIHPLPDTKREGDIFANFNVDLVVTFIMLAVPFVPAAFITFVVREKEVKSKHQQMVSGVGVVAYWISTFVWDSLSFIFTTCIFVFLVAGIFGDDTNALGGGGSNYRDELNCFFGLLILFGMAVAGFSYLLSNIFKQPANAQIVMIFFTFLTGVVLSIIGLVLRLIDETKVIYKEYLRYLFCLFPPFALGDGLHGMSLITFYSAIEQKGVLYKVTDWEITGLPMRMLIYESFGYVMLAILIELVTSIPKVQQYIDNCHTTLPPTDESLKDSDVLAEEERCASGAYDNNSVILVKDLKKQYFGGLCKEGKFAVKGISLGIPNGQCFGLLGINGAGKTSMLSMLSGEFAPSSGKASLAGLDLLTQIHTCRRKIGFCPQFDSLFELLTAREHLELYARVKGIKEQFIQNVVNAKISEMGLTEYADRYAGTYSGGNKRKLSVAIAMIGEPSIVFLDEPSTGMDPVARRFMWDVISDIVSKREKCSVILTTHSMEECEALCTRIGIMVGGVLRCLGSSQRLRNKYGSGYQIEIGMVIPNPTEVDALSKRILTLLNISEAQVLVRLPKTDGSPNEYEEVLAVQDNQLTLIEVGRVFNSNIGDPTWQARLSPTGSGSDMHTNIEAHGFVTLKHLASWMILEKQFDNICRFLASTFGHFVIRERQNTKIRIEVNSKNDDGTQRLLSTMFEVIESSRSVLKLQDYSIAQTSLEQIFNYFAAQQEEEKGSAAGISREISSQKQNALPISPSAAGASQTPATAGGRVIVRHSPSDVELTSPRSAAAAAAAAAPYQLISEAGNLFGDSHRLGLWKVIRRRGITNDSEEIPVRVWCWVRTKNLNI